jgi:two-component system sensor histidine kinase ArlS
MKIRDKILISFSSTVIALTAVAFAVVYLLSIENREEEFQQHQNEKITYTIRLLPEFKKMSEELAFLIDEQTIHDFYDEKMLIYNSKKELIFSSIDSLPIARSEQIINRLSPATRWIETREGGYDLIGVYAEHNNQSYYAISKAYDSLGHSKMSYLRNVLIVMFFLICVVVVVVSLYLSNKIAKPITALAERLNRYDLSQEQVPDLDFTTTTYELQHLTNRFNELLKRTNEAFAFQKHTVHHISHELKTPIAILVSELEMIASQPNSEEIRSSVRKQAEKAKSLGEVIQVLLEISKIDSGQTIPKHVLRMDEVLFDLISELNMVFPDTNFDVHFFPGDIKEDKLTVYANDMLIRHAFLNLLHNAALYGDGHQAEVRIDGTHPTHLAINFYNSGPPIEVEEQKNLFLQYFRGRNSQSKKGFGLGLVLTNKIISHHQGEITYTYSADGTNIFNVRLPFSR